jgi:squalene-hopene/tetraprenyl-beta-curcumene cyclase
MKKNTRCRIGRWALAVAACLLLASGPASTAQAALTPHQEAINQAIGQGVLWLRGMQIQYDAGGVQYGYWDPGWGAYAAGTGMALSALVSNWEPLVSDDPVVDDAHIRRAVNWLLANQLGDGTWGGNQNYEVSTAIWGLAALLAKLPPGSPSLGPVQAAIDAAVAWLVVAQWDEACLWGSVTPADYYYYGGFGYGSHSRPDLSNTQFALVALKAGRLDPAADTWDKAALYVENCQYANHSDGGMWYTPDYPVWGPGSTGSMTGAGVWSYRLCGVPVAEPRVQAGLQWLDLNYTYTQNAAGNPGLSHYYYLWSAAKGFLVCDIKGEIGGLIPVDPADATAFYPGWYYDFSKYLVAQQNPDGHWNTGNSSGGPILDTEYALFVLQKEVGIPYAVQVSIAPAAVAVEPGETADFMVTVENIGTNQDGYDMDVLSLPPGFGWMMADPVTDVPGGEAVDVPLGIMTPADLAIWEDTPYSFSVEATSLSDSGISHATSAVVVLTARATPGSRVRFTDELLTALINQVGAADIRLGLKRSLLAKLENAERKKHQGLERLEAGDTTVAKNMFHAAANILGAFINEVQAQHGQGVAAGDANSFIAQAQDIIWRLEQGIWDSGMPLAKLAGGTAALPVGFVLDQNYPNPFNAQTVITFTLDENGPVRLEIYDVLGRTVRRLVDDVQGTGRHQVVWNGLDHTGRPVASGLYLYRLTVGNAAATKKLLLVK